MALRRLKTDYKSIGIKPWANFIVRALWATVLTVYNRLQVSGRLRVPGGSVIIAPNHTSYLDPPVVSAAAFHRTVAYLGKDGLFRVPVFNTFIWRLGCIPVHQHGADHQAVKLSVEMLNRGFALCLFPEGHRSPDGKLQPLLKGVALIAKKSGAPVIPTAILGTQRALPAGSVIYLPHKILVAFGEPIYYHQFADGYIGPENVLDAFTHQIENGIREQLAWLESGQMYRKKRVSTEKSPSG